jgi:hypothetical protein
VKCKPGDRASRANLVELICVAMMLKGNKMESYRLLAQAARQLKPGGWRLTLIGDGPMRAQVEQMFAGVENVQFRRRAGPASGAGSAGTG